MEANLIIRKLAAAIEYRDKGRARWQSWRKGQSLVLDPQDVPEDLFNSIEEYLFNRYTSIDNVIKDVESGNLDTLGVLEL